MNAKVQAMKAALSSRSKLQPASKGNKLQVQTKDVDEDSIADRLQTQKAGNYNSSTDALQTTTGSAINQGYQNKAKISTKQPKAQGAIYFSKAKAK